MPMGSSIFGDGVILPDEVEEQGETTFSESVSGLGEDSTPTATQQTIPMAPAAPNNGRASAGVSLLIAAAGAAAGYHFTDSLKGAAGGLLAAAGVRNLMGARTGGLQTGLIGLLGVAGGGYLLYSATQQK